MKNKPTIKFILILAIFLGSSLSAIGMALNTEAVSAYSEIPVAVNPTVNIISLDDDETITKSVEQLESVLSPYVEVDITPISDVEFLDSHLDDNLDDYMVLFGHSNNVGIEINDQLVSWSKLSPIVTENKEQLVIIPTCNSMNLYEVNPQAIQNVLSPFENEIDYRISVDFTTMAIGALIQNEELITLAVDELMNDCGYLIYPDETLDYYVPRTEGDTFRITANRRIEVYDVMAEWLNANSFIVGASISTALIQGFLRIIGRGGIPISFIIQIFSVYNNMVNTAWFFATHLGLIFADYVVDKYTDVSWQNTFMDIPGGRFIFYARIIANAKYTFYGVQYVVNGVTKQDYYHVTLCVDTHILDSIVMDDGFTFSILTTAITTWTCTGYGTRIISTGGGGGGIDLPF